MSTQYHSVTIFDTVRTGEISGSATAKQLPDIPSAMIKLKALAGNAGNVYVGVSGVTLPDGTQDVTTGYELDAGQETGWLPISNLNKLFIICDNAGDDLTYIVVI